MKESDCKRYEDLPLFLNTATVAKLLGVSQSSCYELMHEPGFPVLKIGSRMVVPKEQFTRWGMSIREVENQPRAGNRTIEYSYCDYAIALVAKGLGMDLV